MTLREKIYSILTPIAPVTSVGTITGHIEEDLIVLRRNMNLTSMNTDCAGWDQWTTEIYSPISPSRVDLLANNISIELRKNGFEIINLIGGDNFDNNYKAFFSTLTFRTPQTYI